MPTPSQLKKEHQFIITITFSPPLTSPPPHPTLSSAATAAPPSLAQPTPYPLLLSPSAPVTFLSRAAQACQHGRKGQADLHATVETRQRGDTTEQPVRAATTVQCDSTTTSPCAIPLNPIVTEAPPTSPPAAPALSSAATAAPPPLAHPTPYSCFCCAFVLAFPQDFAYLIWLF